MYRIRTVATGVGGGPQYSNLYFSETGGTVVQAHAAVVAFWNTVKARIHSGTTLQVEGEVVLIDEATGQPTGAVTVPQVGIACTDGGSPLPLATQGLIRTLTGAYVGGRQLRGRIYVFNPTATSNLDGGAAGPYRAILDGAGATLVASASAQWVCWSRKNGVALPIQGVNTWEEWGVQRSRRE